VRSRWRDSIQSWHESSVRFKNSRTGRLQSLGLDRSFELSRRAESTQNVVCELAIGKDHAIDLKRPGSREVPGPSGIPAFLGSKFIRGIVRTCLRELIVGVSTKHRAASYPGFGGDLWVGRIAFEGD